MSIHIEDAAYKHERDLKDSFTLCGIACLSLPFDDDFLHYESHVEPEVNERAYASGDVALPTCEACILLKFQQESEASHER